MIGDTVDTAAILGQWTELIRLKVSIETGAVVPSVILRKLAAAGSGNVLSRTLRQRSHAGLDERETSNALRRAVFFHRQGEIRDRTFENQSFRASGRSLITAAIVHWNTVYLDRAVRQLRYYAATATMQNVAGPFRHPDMTEVYPRPVVRIPGIIRLTYPTLQVVLWTCVTGRPMRRTTLTRLVSAFGEAKR